MSDFLRVTCNCGCENRVPVDRRGGIVSCVACGNELPVADDAPIDADDLSTQTELTASAALTDPAKTRAYGPFEEDHAGEAGFSARFRRHEAALYDPSIDERCSRCGRELRGEWDRLESAPGVLCYICANQAADGVPERLKPLMDADDRADKPAPRAYQSRAVFPVRRKLRMRAARIAVAIGAGLFLFSAFTIVIFDIDLPIRFGTWEGPATPGVREINELPTLPWALFQAWHLVGGTVPVFIGVYIALFMNSSLPRDRFMQNLFYAASYCGPFIVIRVMAMMMVWSHGADQVSGALIVVLAAVAQALTLVYIAFDLLEEGAAHCVYFVFLRCLHFSACRIWTGSFSNVSARSDRRGPPPVAHPRAASV